MYPLQYCSTPSFYLKAHVNAQKIRNTQIQWRQTSENPASVGSHLNWAGPHCILGHAGP